MPEEDAQGSEDYESQDTGDENDGLASGFLSRIPEGDRDVVGKYVKQWDAGVTRRFQELHGKYKPYEELADLETLQRAHQLYQILDEDPQRLYHALHEQFGEAGNLDDYSEQQQSYENPELSQFQGVLDELQDRFNKQTEVLEAVAQYVLDTHNSQQESAEDAELDEYMDMLHDEFGNFDDEFVLTKMLNGASGEQAVQAWQEMVQRHIDSASQVTNGLPAGVLSSAGGSAVPQPNSQKLGAVPGRDIRNLIADVMSQVNRESM